MSINSTAEEFILIPKKRYLRMQQKDESYVGRILNDPNVRHKNHQLSFLKRLQTRKQSSDTVNVGLESEPEQSAEESVETLPDEKQSSGQYEKVLFGLSILEGHKLDRVRNILEIVKNSDEITIDEISGNFVLTSLGDTGLKATTFLYNIQQPTKRIDKNLTPYENILNAIDIEEEMVINKYAKAVVRRKLERTQLRSENKKPSTSTRIETNTISLENESKFKTQDDEEEDEFNDAKDNLFTSPTTRGIKQWFTFK